MSLENALLTHAEAIRDLAAAFRERSAPLGALAAQAQSAIAQITEGAGLVVNDKPVSPAREAIQQAPDEAKGGTKKAQDAELEQSVSKVEADAKKNAGAADTATSTAGDTAGPATGAASADLDYEKDVKPVLVKLAGAKGKGEMTALVQSFGVAKATELKGAQLAEIVAQANAMMA